jgi:hypothetical protein
VDRVAHRLPLMPVMSYNLLSLLLLMHSDRIIVHEVAIAL